MTILVVTKIKLDQSNGLTEVTKRTLVQALKTRLGEAKGLWVEELPRKCWAYRTTYRTVTGETPFNLSYDSEVVIPVEIQEPTGRLQSFDEATEALQVNLDLLPEAREVAAIRMAWYHNRVARYHNSRVRGREFRSGHLVLRRTDYIVNPGSFHQTEKVARTVYKD